MGLGLGAAAAASRWACGLPRPPAATEVAWAVDHLRGCLLLVSSALGILGVQPLAGARRLAISPGLWWAVTGVGQGQRVLTRPGGPEGQGGEWEPQWTLPMGAVSQLVALGGRLAYALLEQSEGAGLWRLELGSEPSCMAPPSGTTRRILGARNLLSQDSATGQWVLQELGSGGLRVRRSIWESGALHQALPGAGGSWWCITGNAADRIELRDGRLRLIWSRPLGFGATALVPLGAGVLVLGGKRLSGQRFDREGHSGRPIEWNLRGPLRGALPLGQGCLLALPGALLRLAPDGVIERTQGGFGELLGLVSSDPLARLPGSFLEGY